MEYPFTYAQVYRTAILSRMDRLSAQAVRDNIPGLAHFSIDGWVYGI